MASLPSSGSFLLLICLALICVSVEAQDDCSDQCNYSRFPGQRGDFSERWTEHPLIIPKPGCNLTISQNLSCIYDVQCFPPELCQNSSFFVRLFTINPALLTAADFYLNITAFGNGPTRNLVDQRLTANSTEPGDLDNWNKEQFTYMNSDFWQLAPGEYLHITFDILPTKGSLTLTGSNNWLENGFVMDFKLQRDSSCPSAPLKSVLPSLNSTVSLNIVQAQVDCVYFIESNTPDTGLLIQGNIDFPRTTCDRCKKVDNIVSNFRSGYIQFYNGMDTAVPSSELGVCANDKRCRITTYSNSVAIFMRGHYNGFPPNGGIYCAYYTGGSDMTMNINITSKEVRYADTGVTSERLELGEQRTFTSANFGHDFHKNTTEYWAYTGEYNSKFYLYLNMLRTWSDDFEIVVSYFVTHPGDQTHIVTINKTYFDTHDINSPILIHPPSKDILLNIYLYYTCISCTSVVTKGLAFSVLACKDVQPVSIFTTTTTTTTPSPKPSAAQSFMQPTSILFLTLTLAGILGFRVISENC